MATRPSPPLDPRTIVTPDAFEVSPALLGLPLAPPFLRLAALLIDLAVIGIITALTKNFAVVLGLVVAVLFIREGFKRTPVKGSVFGRAMRLSVGCLGTWIGIITIVVFFAVRGSFGPADTRSDDDADSDSASVSLQGIGALMGLLEGVGDFRRIEEAGTSEEARAAATDLARRGFEMGMSEEQIRDVLVEVIPDGKIWSDETETIVDESIAAALGDTTLARQMAKAVDTTATDTTAGAFADPLVADSLRRLERHVRSLELSGESLERTADELRDELEQERERGVFGWLRDFADELGFGFGWASLYLTVMLSWWKGQTVGKRLLRLRVVRLDGEPITWWTAFERAGGYAAGLATGLLGFAQVFWDSNRQAIHDRITGTVVVVDGAPKVAGWEKAL